MFEHDPAIREGVFKLFATNHSSESSARSLRDLLCCMPRLDAPTNLSYRNIFRVLIMQFIDAHSFDVRSVKKTCVHIVHPDGRLIPFDTYNLSSTAIRSSRHNTCAAASAASKQSDGSHTTIGESWPSC